MSEKPENPQAFPVGASSFGPHGDVAHPEEGMTLRDYFAGQALAAIIARATDTTLPATVAHWSYATADAMLAERERTS